MAQSLFGKLSRRWLILGGAAMAAVAVFGGGALAGQAFNDDDQPQVTRLTLGTNGTQNTGAETDDAAFGRDAGGGASPVSMDLKYGFCPAPLPGGVAGSIIDPSDAGIAARFLSDGFIMSAITLRGEGDCDENGQATNVRPVLETTWIHSATGITVWVSQRASDVPVANYIDEWSAIVYSDGSVFTLSAGGWAMPYLEGEAAVDSDSASVSARVQTAEETRAVMLEAVAQLAPGVSEQCFYRVVPGTWEDLAALGLSDPRGAIPAEFTEQYSNIRLMQEPEEGCDSPLIEGYYGTGMDASFTDASGGWIGISAYRVPDLDEVYVGSSNDYGISWSDGEWQYSIYGNTADGTAIGLAVLTPIAEAFAPDFSEQCLASDRELTAEELTEAGFNQPVVPEGYALESSSWMVNEIPADCADVPENVFTSGYSLSWIYNDGAGAGIEIFVSRQNGDAPDVDTPAAGPGQISPAGISWSDADGTYYNIYAYAPDGSMLDQETLVAIALSLDPELDPATLEEGGEPKPLPAPAEDLAEDAAAATEAAAR